MQEEPADELVRGERHRLPAAGAVDAIVLPAERNTLVIGRDETAIGDGDAVGIAREIAQHLLRPGERVLGVDHPFDLAQWCQEALERSSVSECGMVAEESQAALRVGLDQHRQEASLEKA